ncbi:MAG: hypothetical protein ACI4RK_10710 [Oscillospiraceae bacterium]
MNEKNLIPIRTESEAREKGAAGGRKSGEARRRKKSMKSVLSAMLNADVVSDDIYNSAAEMGVDVMEMTYQAAIIAALIKKAASGDVAAVREIRSIIGEDNDTERVKLQKKQLAMQEKKLSGDDEELLDDGFLDALNGSAVEDWTEGDSDET